MLSTKDQIARKFGIEPKDLLAVIYTNRSWARVEVVGSNVIAAAVQVSDNNRIVLSYDFIDLKTVPTNARIQAAEKYGLKNKRGVVLVVFGRFKNS